MSIPLATFEDDDVDYEDEAQAPFLKNDDPDPSTSCKTTPLPMKQFSVLLSLWVAESVVENSISPYLNQLVRELPIVGGDETKVGYYAGIIVSLHYATEALTAIHLNRLSDHVGRKPVLLTCVAGMIVSIILFGLSRSFLALVLSRCLHGGLKGTIGSVKSMISELTDETNVARGFSLLPTTWAFGSVIGSLIGGLLSRPQDRWPIAFSHPFWAKFPYFLPCLVTAVYAFVSLVLVVNYLEETVKFQPPLEHPDTHREEPSDYSDLPSTDAQKPLPLRYVLTRPVLISVANYASLALLGMVAFTLMPLIWSTPVEYGGLDMSPAPIGVWLSVFGCMNGIFQFAVFPRAVARFGPRWVFITCIGIFVVIYAMFPFENLLRRTAGSPVWLLILLQLTAFSISDMGYSTVFMYLGSAAPNKRSLGATNGLAQSVASIQRTVAPAVAGWLFSFSIANNILGGNFAYIVFLLLVGGGLYVAAQLPQDLWTQDVGWIPLT